LINKKKKAEDSKKQFAVTFSYESNIISIIFRGKSRQV